MDVVNLVTSKSVIISLSLCVEQRKYDVHLDETSLSTNSMLKYGWKLGLGDGKESSERVLLVVDAMQPCRNSQLNPVSLVITTEVCYTNEPFLLSLLTFP